MSNELPSLTATESAPIELKSYDVRLPLASLAIGVDNIHHDVFLSPKFVQGAREYLFELIRQNTSATYFSGIELRKAKGPDSGAFRKSLSDFLQSSLTQAKYQKNIEIDLLFRLALIKFLTEETGNQFANLILEGKEWIRQRGEHFERSQSAHVIKARLSELQSARKSVIRAVGQQVAQILVDVEEAVIVKTRRALFGDDFAPFYDLLKNRLVFLDGGKDDVFFLEHYVLLGNYVRDPDRFEVMDALFQDFMRQAGLQRSLLRSRVSSPRGGRYSRGNRQSRGAAGSGPQEARARRWLSHEISWIQRSGQPQSRSGRFRAAPQTPAP